MKKILFSLLFCLSAVAAFAQTDKIVLHNGKTIEANVKETTSQFVKYSFPGETLVQTLGRPAIASITYVSGRSETISEKVVVLGEADFEKVVILTTTDQAAGLVEKGDVQGKTAAISYQTGATANKASLNRIRKAAAKLGAQFVLMTESTGGGFAGFGASQSIRRGVAYSY